MRILKAKIGVGLDCKSFDVIENAENAIAPITRAKPSGMYTTLHISILGLLISGRSKIAASIVLLVTVEYMDYRHWLGWTMSLTGLWDGSSRLAPRASHTTILAAISMESLPRPR